MNNWLNPESLTAILGSNPSDYVFILLLFGMLMVGVILGIRAVMHVLRVVERNIAQLDQVATRYCEAQQGMTQHFLEAFQHLQGKFCELSDKFMLEREHDHKVLTRLSLSHQQLAKTHEELIKTCLEAVKRLDQLLGLTMHTQGQAQQKKRF